MQCLRSIRTVVNLAMLGACLVTAPARSQETDTRSIDEVAAADKAFATAKGEARAAMMTADFVEVHASGWRYEKQADVEFAKNNELYHPKVEIIRSTTTKPVIRIYNGDTAVVTYASEVYYAVPNEEDLAIAAGTHERDVARVQKWITEQQSPHHMAGPGEGRFPNPYRTRSVHVWSRIGGKWMIVYSQSTRGGQRGSEVLLGEQR